MCLDIFNYHYYLFQVRCVTFNQQWPHFANKGRVKGEYTCRVEPQAEFSFTFLCFSSDSLVFLDELFWITRDPNSM